MTVPVRIGGVTSTRTRYKMRIRACGDGNSLELLRHLTGAAHSQSSLLFTTDRYWAPCYEIPNECRPTSFNLDIQLLRVCRQMHNETALIPYAENNFVFRNGMDSDFRRAFRKRFSRDQRGAIQTAAMLRIEEPDIEAIPRVLPGVKHLWMRRFFRLGYLERLEAKDFSRLLTMFKRVGCMKLVGAGFSYSTEHKDDPDLLEKLEMALLRRSQVT